MENIVYMNPYPCREEYMLNGHGWGMSSFIEEGRKDYRLNHMRQMMAAIEPILDEYLQKAEHIGRLEGLEEGMEKGIQIGQVDIARRLMDLGMSEDIVSYLTGLPEEDIRRR